MTQHAGSTNKKNTPTKFLLGILFVTLFFGFGVNKANASIKILSDSRHAYSNITDTINLLMGAGHIGTDFIVHSTNLDTGGGFTANPATAIDSMTQRYDQNSALVPSAGPYQIFTTSATGYSGDSVSEFNTYAPYDLIYNYAFSNSPATASTLLPPIFHSSPGGSTYSSSYGVEWTLDPVIFCSANLSCVTGANAGIMSVLRFLHSTSTAPWNWFDVKAALRQTGTNWATGYNKSTFGFGQVNYATANALTDGQILLQPPVATVSTSTGRISFTLYPFKQTRRVKEVLFQFSSAPAFNAGELTLSAITALGGTKITEYTGTTATTTSPIFIATTNAYFVWFTADNAADSSANFSRIDTYSVRGPASQNEVAFSSSFNVTSPSNNTVSATQSPTFVWGAADSYLGISKYQLFVDGVLDKDNISGTSTTPTNTLSEGTHTWYVKAFNGGGAATTTVSTPTININTAYTSGYTFYVDNVLGNNNNPGTQALPWATFAKAGTTATAGNTVVIIKNSGIPYRETLGQSNAGTSASRITYRGVDLNSKPEIWGSADISSGWSVYGGGNPDTYQYATTTNVKVLAAGPSINSLTKKTKGTAAATLNPGEWFWVSSVLYYRLAAGETMGPLHIEASMRNYGIQGAVNTTYQDIIVRYANSIGAYLGTSNVTGLRIEAYNSQTGIQVGSGGPLKYSVSANNATYGATSSFPANGTVYNSLFYGNTSGGYSISTLNTTNVTLKNNIIAGNIGPSVVFSIATNPASITANHNLWDNAGDSSWTNTYSGTDNQELVDPLLIATSTSNFALTPLSPAIDTGVAISGLTADILGNHIYGTPDIGPYEYQPPYTIGTNDINITGGVRLYKDGKYRYTNATTTGTTANMNITPVGGFPTGDYSEFLNISISKWNTSGDYSKTWTETSTTATSTAHTVGNLKNNTYYNVLVDSTQYASMLTNGSGQGSFTYAGGYSTHTFDVIENTGAPAAAAPASVATVSESAQVFTWVPAGDPSGIAKYLLYVDSALKEDNIATTSVSSTGFSCGTHTWYVRAINNVGNATDSSIQLFVVNCGGGPIMPPGSMTFNVPAPRMQTITGGVVTYLDTPTTTTVTTTTPTPSVSVPSSILPLTRTLTKGTKGNDVTTLQELLKKDPTIYPEGMVTGYYGALTIAAIQRFQTKYNIITAGDPESTGYGRVGPKTLAKLNEVYGTTGSTSSPQTGSELGTTSPKTLLTGKMSLGSKGDQVTLLQTGLATDPSIYPEGEVTGYYGQLTVAAVQRFQIKYGLGDTTSPGYGGVGPMTLAKFNEVFGGSLK